MRRRKYDELIVTFRVALTRSDVRIGFCLFIIPRA
jgi:hypothetical protein